MQQDPGFYTVKAPGIPDSKSTLVISEPVHMVYKDLPNVEKTIYDTLEDDPFSRYLLQTKKERKRNPLYSIADKVFRRLSLIQYVRNKTGYTIDGGDAFVAYTDPAKPRRRFYIVLEAVAARLIPSLMSKEQRERWDEVHRKLTPALKKLLETHGQNMFCLEHVAVVAGKQGLGYGTTLCKLVTAEADVRQLDTYLLSSNVKANTTFYNNLGFYTERQITLGEDNPKWREPPVVVDLMIRYALPVDMNEKSYLQNA